MKTAFSAVVAAIPLMGSAFSMTIGELSPSALTGKTLDCAIEYSAAPFASEGKWTATFETSPAGGFTIRNVTGDTVDGSGTVALKSFADNIYTYTVTPFIKGESPCSLYLWIVEGVGHYEVELVHPGNVYVGSVGGTFTFGSAPKAPDIEIQQPAGSRLTDGVSKKNFGTAKIGGAGVVKTFVLKNTGKARLAGLSIGKKGANRGDFTVAPLSKTSLAAGASTTFKVTFKPSAKGTRNAAIAIASNDPDENPFDIKLSGEGVK